MTEVPGNLYVIRLPWYFVTNADVYYLTDINICCAYAGKRLMLLREY